MSIRPVTNEIEPIRLFTLKDGSAAPLKAPDDRSADDDAFSLSISGEAIKLSKSAMLQVEMSVKLSQAVKANGQKGLNTGNYFEDLANSYDQLHKTLNENSENSNKNGKYLDEAFRQSVSSAMALSGAQIGRSLSNEAFPIPLVNGVNPYVDSARKQAEVFSDAFLKDYKKNGVNALGTALNALSNMPETNSLSNISYNDLKTLSDLNEKGMLNTKSGIAEALKESGLSDFMRSYLASLAE